MFHISYFSYMYLRGIVKMKWNEIILSKITNSILDISIVIDNDNILNDESILLEINKDNYEILEMNDLEEVRLVIEMRKESKYAKKLLIVSKKYKKEEIPYDFQRDWDVIELKLHSLFDGLDYNVLKNIDSSLYGEIYEKFIKERKNLLGKNDTLNFIIRKIYEIDICSIDTDEKLISILLKIYLNKNDIDKYIGSYLLKKVDEYISCDIPFSDLISDKKLFWNYMQEQWNLFINDKINNTNISKINFHDKDIIYNLQYLFYEGYLQPLKIDKIEGLDDIFKAGIYSEDIFDNKKVESLIEKIELIELKKDNIYTDWTEIAESIATVEHICNINKKNIEDNVKNKLDNIINNTEKLFKDWLIESYGALANLSYTKRPIMVHHIPKYISYKRKGKLKVALIIIDGLALNQWKVIEEYISNIKNIKIKSNVAFAWVPTITSVSRQAIFSGKIPSQFKDSIYTTNKEESHWKLFWQEQGFKVTNIKYKKCLGKDNINETLDFIKDDKVNTIGLVIDIVDKIMHGQQLGNEGMIQNIRVWMENGYLISLLETLLNYGYNIYLTSDHGNVGAKGIGIPRQGSTSETKGQRCRIYSNELLIEDIKDKYDSIVWPGYGLPEDMKVCVPNGNRAYIKENDDIISHGGISIKEVIVPFIEIWKDEN